MKNADTTIAKSKYAEVSELGSKYNLSFSSQFVLGKKIIALDGVKRALLVVDTDSGGKPPSIIDLNKVSAITVRKTYGSINQGELKDKGLEAFLKGIDLQFKRNDNTGTIALSFYNSDVDDKRDRGRLGKTARNWQLILSKLIGKTNAKNKNTNDV